ncbi:hypothetical protein [Mycobacteroides abscessus]|uniref:hypothetical protein n=1 Tax=Mycobacteroides abscessus TaxID=36809 RepID=UPI002105D500|nr:hypothetical protein [Mycobacteroides abscessus]
MDFLTIPDRDLQGIEPQDVEAFLRAIGWQQQGGVPGVSNQWVYGGDRRHPVGSIVAVVPIDATFDDYTRRIREVLDKISKVYPRRPESILLEIELPGSDEIENRKHSPSISGSIAWRAAENQIVGFRKALVASAKAAEDRQRQFARSHRKIAQEYLGQLRMGQTRPGSFIITALSPTGPLPTTDRGAVYDDHLGITGRDVVETLTTSLTTLHIAAEEYLDEDRDQVFDATIPDGVSIDLIKGMIENLGTAEGTEISVDWNPQVPRESKSKTTTVTFESKHRAALKAAQSRLQTLSAAERVTILGNVTNLDRKTPRDPGVITVDVIDGADAATVKIRLEGEYNETVESHKSGDLIRIAGVLRQENTQHWITTLDELALIDSRGDVRTVIGPAALGRAELTRGQLAIEGSDNESSEDITSSDQVDPPSS